MLFIVKRIAPTNDGHANYDAAHGFVVRAESAEDAREIAAENCGDEGRDIWKDPARSTSQALLHHGERGIVLTDFNAG